MKDALFKTSKKKTTIARVKGNTNAIINKININNKRKKANAIINKVIINN